MNLLNCRKQKKPQGEMGIFVSYLWQNRKTRSLLLTVMRKHLMIHHSPHVGRKTTPKFSPGFRAIHLFLVPSSPWLLRGLERGRLESIPQFSHRQSSAVLSLNSSRDNWKFSWTTCPGLPTSMQPYSPVFSQTSCLLVPAFDLARLTFHHLAFYFMPSHKVCLLLQDHHSYSKWCLLSAS